MNKSKKTATSHNNEEKQIAKSPLAKNQELEDQLKRTLADYQNLERRVEEERRLLGKLSTIIIVEKLLPVLDNLESAQEHLKDQGLEIVIKQFKDVLTSEGVEEIQATGAQFDPNLHEAVEITEGENDGTIVKVQVKGYKIEGRVLRAAKVVVSKGKDHEDYKQPKEVAQSQMTND